MSVDKAFPEMDDAELLGLLLEDFDQGAEDPFPACENMHIEDWFSRQDILNSLDTEDFLNSILSEDENIPVQSLSPLGSDSGISDISNPQCQSPRNSDTDPAPCYSPEVTGSNSLEETEADLMMTDVVSVDHCYSLRHEQFDGNTLLSVRSEQPDTDVFIDLDSDDWNPDSVVEMCSELPCTLAIEDPSPCNKANEFQFKEIVLTAEEKRLLEKEGVTIPSQMPLTKAEERTLKRVRRKIRNKQSAQESRKKKKVYVDGLENRVAVCTAQNQELQKKVQLLQKQNMSLIEQVRKLQSLIKLSSMKTSTTTTCLMVFLLSFCLIIFPSFNPFGSSGGQKDVYTPTGVLSRTIRSIPVTESEEISTPMDVPGEDDLLLVSKAEVINAMLASSQNHTPDYEQVEQPESESAVSSNSSSDFPTLANAESKAADPELERLREAAVAPIKYQGAEPEKKWAEQKSITVIIQKHHSDEM